MLLPEYFAVFYVFFKVLSPSLAKLKFHIMIEYTHPAQNCQEIGQEISKCVNNCGINGRLRIKKLEYID